MATFDCYRTLRKVKFAHFTLIHRFSMVLLHSSCFAHGANNIVDTETNASAFLAANAQHKMYASPLAAEIATYLALPILPVSKSADDERSIILMWAECERSFTFYRQHKAAIPLLFELARSAFATPLSAAEIERGFSVSSKMGAPDRNFKPNALKRMMMLNNNYRFSQLI